MDVKGVVGIQNMGNTCYCNSVIQLLRACHDLNGFCLTNDFTNTKESKYKNILLAYQDILKSLWSASKPAYVKPIGFLTEIKKAVQGTVYEMFGMPIPNDSHEFLIYLLDSFYEATKEDNSEIMSLFYGKIRKTICCNNCKNNTYQWEIFNTLKIPCEGNTLKEWVQNELKETEIENYHCENCNSRKYSAKIYSHIWKLPKNLFITIRRFNPNGSKNMTSCPYDGSNIQFTELFESDDPSKNWVYELKGICDHHGSHRGGHYTTQFKHPVTNEWWKMDDESTNKQLPQFSSNYIFLFRAIHDV